MNKEDRKLLEKQGFTEDRSFYHSWSKDTEKFSVFAKDKKNGYVSMTIMSDENNGIRCQADLMIEVEDSENFEDYSTIHLFTIYKPTVQEGISSIYSYLKNIGNGYMSSLGKCTI